ncbi:selenium-dependent xanthine dehydrogenase [Anaerococcus sp. Marseille-P3915]|uniref:selenium-dependent xanthine dehydrogenase n=1 Tax=Anaerococcus sp. Marseille-P3915 TaxID=2057799 RepID=UPI000D0B654C|nr:selenium-dependent xanthine dehydrogenase [Anaerococcus sp. Marseille-P3915]
MTNILIGERLPNVEPFLVKINGNTYETYEDKSLLRFLRDDLHITSVKDGCSQGACGTCSVIVGDAKKLACTQRLSKLKDQEILTIEGLTELEKKAFVHAFSKAGAVQCGFCIPGMVMSGAAIIRKNPNPTKDEIKEGIKQNICRCTGYVKIVEGIKLASEIINGSIEMTTDEHDRVKVGDEFIRIDAHDKVLGIGEYVDDMIFDDMKVASAIRSKYPRARILKIDKSKAEALEGVYGVLTAADVPNNKVGHIFQDWDVFIAEGDVTRSQGDAICLVVAENDKILEEAKKLVEIEYEELTPVSSIAEAENPNSPFIHPTGNLCQERHVSRGNVEEAFKKCKYIVEETYTTPFTEHAFLEPECAIAEPIGDGVKIYTTDQSVYDTRKETLIMFGWEDQPERVVVENKLIGGAFGGKEDVSCQHLAALAAYKFQIRVKIKFSRDESLKFHPKRHPMIGTFKLGCDEEGNFLAMQATIKMDTGAYASLCGPVLERACTHSVGPYHYENTQIDGYGYYTNNPPAGAFRGFGVCQSNFAFESNINLLAEKVGISPWEIRYKNAIRPGEVLPNGQIADSSTALVETLEAVKDVYEENIDRAGIACAMKNAGVGVGLPDKGRAKIRIEDGKVNIYCAASDLGQGAQTVFKQMALDVLGLSFDQVNIIHPNSGNSPDSGTSSGSRQTLISGEAIKKVTEKLKIDLDKVDDISKLEGKEYFHEYFDPTDPLNSDKENPVSHIAYGFSTNVVILNDDGTIRKVVAATDAGKVINPKAIEGQLEGGIVMGLGYALTEDFKLDKSKVKAKYGNLGLWRAPMIPEIETTFVAKPDDELLDRAFGAKGVGEIATIPIAPAVQGAYYKLDGILRRDFPMVETAYSKPKKNFNE